MYKTLIYVSFGICIIFSLISLNARENISQSYIIKLENNHSKQIIKLQSNDFTFRPIIILNPNDKKKIKLQSKEQEQYFDDMQNYYILLFKDKSKINTILESFRNNPDVINIEPNYIYHIESDETPNDPLYTDQWALKNIDAAKAWKIATGEGIIVGVVDTGIDFTHPDLINQLWINKPEDINKNGKFEPWDSKIQKNGIYGDLNGIDDDGNGYVDDVIGYDFVDQTVFNLGDSKNIDPIPTDEHGHGTETSGVIAAEQNNHIGISGLAFDSKVMMLRAFDATGNAESDDIASSIVYAVLQGAKVLNFSFGEVYSSTIIHDAVKFAYSLGCVMAASSGNNNWNLPHYPSDYKEVISVGASTDKNLKASLSNYGNRLDLLAPGQSIMTTIPNGEYGKKSGTSFSAPYVCGTAALLLENNPDLSPSEIKGILQESAVDKGDIAWDLKYGSGILNVNNALNYSGISSVELTNPINNSYFNKNNQSNILISGTIISPMFDSYRILLGKGFTPTKWDTISENIYTQKKAESLGTINISNMQDTLYTLRILVNLKNNNSVEKRMNFWIFSDKTPLKILTLKTINAFFENRRVAVIYAKTNTPSRFNIKFREKNSNNDYHNLDEFMKYTQFHSIKVENNFNKNIIMEAIAYAERMDDSKDSMNFEFNLKNEYFPNNTFNLKDYSIPLSYLNNDVGDLYGDNKNDIVVNDISSGTWGNIKIYEFDKNKFELKDQINNSWIPKGIGETNGEGIKEILATALRESVLFQAKSKGDSPFSKVLFADTLSAKFWGAELVDLDKDGRDEIIGYDDSTFFAYKFINGKYTLLATAAPNDLIGTYPGFSYGDFDNDGKLEIAFGNREGYLYIFEFSNNTFQLEFADTTKISASEQYFDNPDVDGDGTPEILIANFGSTIAYGQENVSSPIWTYRLLKATGVNKYKVIWQDNVYGVRGGLDYQNGISKGDLDNLKGHEIIISAFPNLYILKWDKGKQTFLPLWNYPYSFSNTAIVYDFDGNGKNDLGFSTFSGTRFYEFNSEQKPKTPLAFRAWSTGQNSAYFNWQKTDDAKYYEIIRMLVDNQNSGYIGYTAGISDTTFLTIDTLQANTHYEFVVRAFNDDLATKNSNISNFAEVYTHDTIYPENVFTKDCKNIFVDFSGDLPTDAIESSNFLLYNFQDSLIAQPSTVHRANDTLALLSFSKQLPKEELKLKINSFRDRYNSPTKDTVIDFIINCTTKQKELFLTKLELFATNTLLLDYSEPVDTLTATNIDNYDLQPYGKIAHIIMNYRSPASVFIYLDKSEPLAARGKNYILTVKNVIAVSSNKITTASGNSLGFVFFTKDGNDAYVYPNPIHQNEISQVYFANLPPKAEVNIINLDGKILQTLYENNSNGGVEWDGRDKNGNLLDNGIYLFKVITINPDGSKIENNLKKFIIVP